MKLRYVQLKSKNRLISKYILYSQHMKLQPLLGFIVTVISIAILSSKKQSYHACTTDDCEQTEAKTTIYAVGRYALIVLLIIMSIVSLTMVFEIPIFGGSLIAIFATICVLMKNHINDFVIGTEFVLLNKLYIGARLHVSYDQCENDYEKEFTVIELFPFGVKLRDKEKNEVLLRYNLINSVSYVDD